MAEKWKEMQKSRARQRIEEETGIEKSWQRNGRRCRKVARGRKMEGDAEKSRQRNEGVTRKVAAQEEREGNRKAVKRIG